jgi:hypothetical protein
MGQWVIFNHMENFNYHDKDFKQLTKTNIAGGAWFKTQPAY